VVAIEFPSKVKCTTALASPDPFTEVFDVALSVPEEPLSLTNAAAAAGASRCSPRLQNN
jgi:hypothetical protein